MNSMALAAKLIGAAYSNRTGGGARTPGFTAWEAALLRWLLCGSFAALAGALLTQAAFAETATVGGFTAEFNMFDGIEDEAQTTSNDWFSSILGMVRPTFLLLATLEICWAAAIWALEKDNLNSLAVEIIQKIMFIGFFFALLQFAPEWIPSITNSFQQVGQQATGTEPLTTDRIIATGLALIRLLWSEAPSGVFAVLGKLGQILVACFVTLGIIIAYVVLAAQYFTLKVESYILFAAGAIFLGLGSSRWTNEYVSKYLNYAINVGVRILVLILVLSLMLSTVERLSENYSFDYEPLLKLLAIAVLQAILGIKAPEMAGALLSGGSALTAGSASSAATSAVGRLKSSGGLALGAAGAALNVARGAVGKGVSGVQGVGNLAKAVSAGSAQAKEQGKGSAAATLSGLGAVASQVAGQARDAAKAAPGKLVGALKGKGERGQQPGFLDRAKQSLQARTRDSGSEATGSASGVSAAASATAGANISATDSKGAAAASAPDSASSASTAAGSERSSIDAAAATSTGQSSSESNFSQDDSSPAVATNGPAASNTSVSGSAPATSTTTSSASPSPDTSSKQASATPTIRTANKPNKLRKATAPSRPLPNLPKK